MRAIPAVAVLCFAACQAPPPPEPEFTDADRQAIAEEIERLTLEMFQFNRTEDAAKWLEYYSPSAESYFVTEPALFCQGVGVIATMQDLRDFTDPSRWNRQSTNFTLQSSRVAVLSPELAVQVGQSHWNITNMEGETGPTYPQTATTVWVKEDGAWKILHHHQSWTNTPIEGQSEG